MGPVSAEIEIDVPRRRAFEAIADLSLRPAFTDHFLSDFHLTRIEPTGIRAGPGLPTAHPPPPPTGLDGHDDRRGRGAASPGRARSRRPRQPHPLGNPLGA